MRRFATALLALAACSGATPPPAQKPPPKVVPRGQLTLLHAFPDEWRLGFTLGDCDDDGKVEAVRSDGTVVRWDESFNPKATAIPGFPPDEMASTVLLADVNGDRWLDVVSAGPGGVNLRLGTGKCAFGPPQTLGRVETGQAVQILATDADRDGLTDLLLGVREDPEGSNRLYIAKGDGSFEEVRIPEGGEHQGPSDPHLKNFQFYAALLDDVDGDGLLDLFSWNDQGWSFFAWGAPGRVPSFEPDPERVRLFGATSPMSVVSLDADRDGKVEYFVANVPGDTDLISVEGRDSWRRLGRRAGFGDDDKACWGSYALDANRDGWTDLLVMRTENGANYLPATPALFMNQRDGTFRDVGLQAKLDTPLESRALSCGDIGGDGRPSCIVGHAQGSRLLRNELELPGNWVGVRLAGTVSSPDASGARLTEEGDGKQTVAYGVHSPTYGAHDPEAFFALGDRPTAKLRIVWPSGLEELRDDLNAGTHHTLLEPKVFELDRRLLPADGAGTVTVTVDLDEAHASAATIEREGDGAWAGPASREGNLVVRRLVAPHAPGEARITVALDGKPLLVRPRVRFVAP